MTRTERKASIPDWIFELEKGDEFNGNDVRGWGGVEDPYDSSWIVEPIDIRYGCRLQIQQWRSCNIMIHEDLKPEDENKKFLVTYHYIDRDPESVGDTNFQRIVDLVDDLSNKLNRVYTITELRQYRWSYQPTYRNKGNVDIPGTCEYERYVIIGEGKSMNAARNIIKKLRKEHIQPLVDARRAEERARIKEKDGELCKTVIGCRYDYGSRKQVPGTKVSIGDYVVLHDNKFKGWLFKIVQEDTNRRYPLRIQPAFCGIQQVDFNMHRKCVTGYDIEPIDIIELGRSFQQLQHIITAVMSTKTSVPITEPDVQGQ